ncbi:hypothetical protein [Sporofaciens musculi]|uniref:hypothetical protein n=1 Tax=Sporofaciens musculi TaxID=2681861 RepID=UPI0025706FE3|nr:hypothetical protein [Sporofaciens musculi]
MELIEMIVIMGKDGVLQLPKEEVEVMGLKPGDEICLSYFAESMEKKENRSGEFLLEKRG